MGTSAIERRVRRLVGDGPKNGMVDLPDARGGRQSICIGRGREMVPMCVES